MNSVANSLAPESFYSLPHRAVALTVLVLFATTALLGFSLYINLRPAQALFHSAAVAFLLQKAWEFVQAFASAFMAKFIANFALKALQKLEELYVINNILYYADALEFDQYIGNGLNKVVLKLDPSSGETVSASTNLTSIIKEANLGAIAGLPGSQIGQLALLAAQGRSGGLTEQQEKILIRGAIASLTSQAACGGINDRAIRNVAIYTASKNAGIDINRIDPRSGLDFYAQLARFGNPYTNPSFMELSLRDYAAQAEAEAKRAAAMELQSAGFKSPRGSNGLITQSAGEIHSFIQGAVNGLFDSQQQTADTKLSFSGAGKLAGKVIADIITAAIFKQGGRLIAENPACGVGSAITAGAPVTPITPGPGPDSTGDIFLTVNGKSAEIVLLGESATIAWDAGNIEGSVNISGLGPVPRSGSRTVTPTAVGVTIYELTIGGELYGAASLEVVEQPSSNGGSGGGGDDLSLSIQLVPGNQGGFDNPLEVPRSTAIALNVCDSINAPGVPCGAPEISISYSWDFSGSTTDHICYGCTGGGTAASISIILLNYGDDSKWPVGQKKKLEARVTPLGAATPSSRVTVWFLKTGSSGGGNQPPVIESLNAPALVAVGATVNMNATVSDPEGDPLTVRWAQLKAGASCQNAPSIAISGASGLNASFVAPTTPSSQGNYQICIRFSVEDGNGPSVAQIVRVDVVEQSTLYRYLSKPFKPRE